jgi:hypothetical protein
MRQLLFYLLQQTIAARDRFFHQLTRLIALRFTISLIIGFRGTDRSYSIDSRAMDWIKLKGCGSRVRLPHFVRLMGSGYPDEFFNFYVSVLTGPRKKREDVPQSVRGILRPTNVQTHSGFARVGRWRRSQAGVQAGRLY